MCELSQLGQLGQFVVRPANYLLVLYARAAHSNSSLLALYARTAQSNSENGAQNPTNLIVFCFAHKSVNSKRILFKNR